MRSSWAGVSALRKQKPHKPLPPASVCGRVGDQDYVPTAKARAYARIIVGIRNVSGALWCSKVVARNPNGTNCPVDFHCDWQSCLGEYRVLHGVESFKGVRRSRQWGRVVWVPVPVQG